MTGKCLTHGCQMAIARFLDCMCLALWASGLWLRCKICHLATLATNDRKMLDSVVRFHHQGPVEKEDDEVPSPPEYDTPAPAETVLDMDEDEAEGDSGEEGSADDEKGDEADEDGGKGSDDEESLGEILGDGDSD